MPDRTLTTVGFLLLIAFAAVPAASAVTVYPGSEVTLTGTSTGSDTVYLFVIGSNLPANGGRLEDPHTAVRSGDPAGFTAVTVGADGRWTYRWRTGEAGLDPGTYTVYVVDAPVDRSDLSGHGYTTLSVTLGTPPGTAAPATVAASTVLPTTLPAEPEATSPVPAATPSPTPTAATTPLAALAAAGAVLVATFLLSRR